MKLHLLGLCVLFCVVEHTYGKKWAKFGVYQGSGAGGTLASSTAYKNAFINKAPYYNQAANPTQQPNQIYERYYIVDVCVQTGDSASYVWTNPKEGSTAMTIDFKKYSASSKCEGTHTSTKYLSNTYAHPDLTGVGGSGNVAGNLIYIETADSVNGPIYSMKVPAGASIMNYQASIKNTATGYGDAPASQCSSKVMPKPTSTGGRRLLASSSAAASASAPAPPTATTAPGTYKRAKGGQLIRIDSASAKGCFKNMGANTMAKYSCSAANAYSGKDTVVMYGASDYKCSGASTGKANLDLQGTKCRYNTDWTTNKGYCYTKPTDLIALPLEEVAKGLATVIIVVIVLCILFVFCPIVCCIVWCCCIAGAVAGSGAGSGAQASNLEAGAPESSTVAATVPGSSQ